MTVINGETSALLVECGWFEEREVDTAPVVASLLARGFEINDAAVDFLREFGGLRCYGPAGQLRERQYEIEIGISAVNRHPSNIESISRLFGTSLCPIGSVSFHDFWNFVLLVAPDGQVYGLSDEGFSRYHGSGIIAMISLIEGRDSEDIDIWKNVPPEPPRDADDEVWLLDAVVFPAKRDKNVEGVIGIFPSREDRIAGNNASASWYSVPDFCALLENISGVPAPEILPRGPRGTYDGDEINESLKIWWEEYRSDLPEERRAPLKKLLSPSTLQITIYRDFHRKRPRVRPRKIVRRYLDKN